MGAPEEKREYEEAPRKYGETPRKERKGSIIGRAAHWNSRPLLKIIHIPFSITRIMYSSGKLH